MRINHNITALNTYNKLSSNNSATQKSLEKLSSGLRINKAGDDAAGLAISEKMRGQIRGLDMASKNSSDGISMISTAEGALSETHSILQRMKELATQASNGTNTDADRAEIQKEVNQLSSEINRIGNTTEFNTQSLLKGDGKTTLAKTGATLATHNGDTTNVQATTAITVTEQTAATNSGTFSFELNGEKIDVKIGVDTGLALGNTAIDSDSVTSNSVTVNYNAANGSSAENTTDLGSKITDAINAVIAKNSKLAGNYSASYAGGDVTIAATSTGSMAGSNGYISAGASALTGITGNGTTADAVGTTTYDQSYETLTFNNSMTSDDVNSLIGKGFTVNGKQYEFYDADAGSYKGNATGINISAVVDATSNRGNALATAVSQQLVSDGTYTAGIGSSANIVKLTATAKGTAGNDTIVVEDGGIQKNFKTTFQVGANQGQSFAIEFSDMRSKALGITGTTAGGTAANNAVFTKVLDVTNGTDDTNVEYALDVSTTTNASNAIKVLDNAITTVSAERSKMGAYQNRLEHTINNLGTTSENLSAAESRIRDVDMAKEMMEFTKNNILSQAAQSMLAQANQQPQKVLQLLQ